MLQVHISVNVFWDDSPRVFYSHEMKILISSIKVSVARMLAIAIYRVQIKLTSCPWAVTLSWLKSCFWFVIGWSVMSLRAIYKSLCPAVTIYDSLVNPG